MVSAELCAVVEGIHSLKSEITSYITTHGGIRGAGIALYREMIASDFVRKVSETFVTRILLIGISMITSVIVARILGPEGRGLYAVAGTIGALGAQFGNLGLHASNTYWVARDKSLLPALVGNTLFISFAFGGSVAFLVWAVFTIWPSLAPIQGMLLILACIWIPFGLAYMLSQNLLLGIQEVRAYNKIEVILQFVGLISIGATIIFHIVTAETVFSAGLIALVFGLVWALWMLKPYLSRRPTLSRTLFKEHVSYGIKAYSAAFFAFMVLRIDLLMVKYMLGAEQAGYYSIAVTMTDMLFMLPSVTGMILFPQLAVISHNRGKWQFTKRVVLWISLAMLIITVFSSLLAAPLVKVLFGKDFLPAVPAFVWLMPGIFILSINIIFMNFFASIGMPLITVYSPGIAAIVNILLNMKLIPAAGIVGASISSTLSYGLMLLASTVYIRRMKRTILT